MSETPEQLDLFCRKNLNSLAKVKAAMSRAVKDSGLSRDQLLDCLVDLARAEGISFRAGNGFMSTFEKWLNPSDRDHVMPLKLLTVFCAATGDLRPIAALAWPLDGDVIGSKEKALLSLGRAAVEKKRVAQLARQAEEEAREQGLL